MRISGQPVSAGQVTPGADVSASPLYPAGGGSGSGRFTVTGTQGVVDALRVRVLSESSAAVLMEVFLPVYFRFKGGKGIATAFGALTAMNPLLGLSALGVVALGTLVSRRMSVGSLLGAMALPVLTMEFEMNFMFGAFFLSAVTIYKHWPNIARLRAGTEPKISFGSKKS